MKSLVLCLFALFAPYAEAGDLTGTADWLAVGKPGFLQISGTGGHVTGHVEIDANGLATGTFEVKLAEYTTGMGLRDKHMKEKYLEVAKYPIAKLTLQSWKPTTAESKFVGVLELKGQQKQVVGEAAFNNGHLAATFKVNLDDFPGVGVPSWAGVTVANEVTVTVAADVK